MAYDLQLTTYDNLLLSKRGWTSMIPKSKKAVMLVSGGYDSIVTAARLINDYGMELYPMYINRDSRNKEGELSSITFFTNWFTEHYPGKFHDVFMPNVSIPPVEIKQRLQEYAKTHRYPMRDFIMQMFAVQYAASLGEDVRTICNGVIETDSIASVTINRLNTLGIVEMTKEDDWNILSINIDPEISDKPFSKSDEIRWAINEGIPGEYTMTCWTPVKASGRLLHCGECYACKERQTGFNEANVTDPTPYNTQPQETL